MSGVDRGSYCVLQLVYDCHVLVEPFKAGGMGWDAIYWHVWAACVVFRVDGIMISALEVDRYVIEPDGLLIRAR